MPDLSKMSTAAICRRMERSTDFKYDDEAVELTRRLKEKGMAWKWSSDFYHPTVEIITQEEWDRLRAEQERRDGA